MSSFDYNETMKNDNDDIIMVTTMMRMMMQMIRWYHYMTIFS